MNYTRLKIIPQFSFGRTVDLHRNVSLHPTKRMLSKTKNINPKQKKKCYINYVANAT